MSALPFAQRLRLAPGQGGIGLWLKSSAYTRRLLQGSAEADVWQSPAGYLAWFSQAHGLLRPDVAMVEIGELYDAWIAREGGLEERLGKRRTPTMALRRLLEDDTPRVLLAEVLDAVDAHLRGQTPIALAMPSPRRWLRHANRLASQPDDPPDDDTVEDATIYLTELLRSVSAKPVSCVLLEEAPDDAELLPSVFARYRSLANLAQHYRWSLALRLPRGLAPVPVAGFDAVIADDGATAAEIASVAVGRDASAAFAQAAAPAAVANGFRFVELAPSLRPETVLDTLQAWRAAG